MDKSQGGLCSRYKSNTYWLENIKAEHDFPFMTSDLLESLPFPLISFRDSIRATRGFSEDDLDVAGGDQMCQLLGHGRTIKKPKHDQDVISVISNAKMSFTLLLPSETQYSSTASNLSMVHFT